MKIPTDFDLTDVIGNQSVAPPPRKPRLQKHDLFMDIKKFKAIDEHAIKVSKFVFTLKQQSLSLLTFVTRTLKLIFF